MPHVLKYRYTNTQYTDRFQFSVIVRDFGATDFVLTKHMHSTDLMGCILADEKRLLKVNRRLLPEESIQLVVVLQQKRLVIAHIAARRA